jgi:hypothetical protein
MTDTITFQNIDLSPESPCMSLPGHRMSKAPTGSVSLYRTHPLFLYFVIKGSAIKQIKEAQNLASFPKRSFEL